MKTKFITSVLVFSMLAMVSCKKDKINTTPLASIQITNAVAGGATLQFGSNAATIANNSYTTYGVFTGNQVLKLSSTDAPNLVYYNQAKDLVNGGLYSLFLTGIPTAVESVFIKEENIPSHMADVFGARVINLSTGSVPISVNLKGSANGSLVGSLAYKAISSFKDVSSLASEGTKTFEFRNASTGELIITFDVPDYDLPRFRNITLVFVGVPGSETIIRNNNY